MGQKTHPKGFRLGIVTDWDSKWFAEKDYARFLHEDLKIQGFIKNRLKHAGISKIEIQRYPDKRIVNIYTARPGIVIGRRGGEVDKLRLDLEKFIGHEVRLNIEEVKRAEMDAQLVAEGISLQLEKRIHLKKAMKKAVEFAIRSGAEGIKIKCSGRIGGAEMARTEQEKQGRIPLHTLRAIIDYGFSEAQTIAGKIGVKVWIFKGEKLSAIEEIKIGRSGQSERGSGLESRDRDSRERDQRDNRGGGQRDSGSRGGSQRDSRGGSRGGSSGGGSRGGGQRGGGSRDRGPQR
ncbi:MAG: 30S ribosomal protein S3 [Candidatus Poribacteria bacterium]